ncbi:Na(+)-translocating NADH-quinone reductase subunit A [Thiothrix lacustris]|uniref:Na(+)-translocating NADH-quinone reductase subunit A n=1 Tax=Thiothrix lacustris TaxID=525917 RepID=A0ABY9MU59_9GAMM|nr:Na(+)-translocating NADH-quinone reductase subunit A [Thiothrix lacustris]WML92053.1 Na(+)-translocating NADH-quinone reductase subunit A [Thiothrix lacustris]WMP16130.1 Na(+)-translocating NADH-quinone reductase subunit A [Thiothrix lacustris]
MKISKGLDLPIIGKPEQAVYAHPAPQTVAVLGRDFHDLRPALQVQEGDRVKRGQVLFTDRKSPGVNFTSPGGGVVKTINRGAKRVLNSVVIELDDEEEDITFPAYTPAQLSTLDAATIRQQLLDSGQWIAFRTRPYSKVPKADATPASIFVTAIDTYAMAADPLLIINAESEAFQHGLQLLSKLAPKVFVNHKDGAELPLFVASNITYTGFSGPHPAGLPGTHIHFLDPVSEHKTVWHIGYQDVIAIGKLFTTGKLYVDRVISLAGPTVLKPRLLRTRLCASTDDIVDGQLDCQACRVIAGSLLSGFRAAGWSAYLGRYTVQVAVVAEGQPRVFMHWLNPMLKQFSFLNVFLSPGVRGQQFAMTTSQNGSHRAMVPLGNYEEVMPLDILPTQLLRSLLVRDTVMAQQLGALELDEDDLALCTFVCHSKYEYGPALRECLRMLEKGE